MTTILRISIIDPKAEKLLKDLEDMNLIAIHDISKNGFAEAFKELRSNAKSVPSLEEIAEEVKIVRRKRYAEKG